MPFLRTVNGKPNMPPRSPYPYLLRLRQSIHTLLVLVISTCFLFYGRYLAKTRSDFRPSNTEPYLHLAPLSRTLNDICNYNSQYGFAVRPFVV